MTRCDKCHRPAIIHQRYSGMHLCGEHLSQDVHRKIRESLRRTGLFSRGSCMAVGLDGGRQSATLAHILKSIFSRRRDMEIFAVIIDMGEAGCCSASQARAVAERLEMDCRLLHWPDRDIACDSVYERRCEILLQAAAEMGAGILATGECLDDEALRIFVSYLRGDTGALLAGESRQKYPAWIKPLQRVPRREARLYALQHGLGFDPAAGAGRRDLFREAADLLGKFEGRHPGTFYSLLRGVEKGLRAKPLSVDAK